ncbi:MAG: ABC transporter ATP-binding protein [Clostridiales bacterium]|uniref:ABC transporter ATP-binding protein n=1 Tax=Zhenhengia sp. TaxID=2944208 RepID=UPI002912A386|nr:ABC transporter ATP-binding protein [Clostridiales bacterium]MDU6358396.1 ABC transporter ATP-binding protein [Clostridiales bacterium]
MNQKELLKRYVMKYKWFYIFGVLILLLVDYMQLFIPKIIGMVTDGIKDGSMASEGIITMVMTLIGVTLVMALSRIGWRYCIIGSSKKIERDLRADLFEKWVELDAQYFNAHKTGNLMAYATNDLNAIRMMVGPGVITIFDAVIMTFLVIGQMAFDISLQLTLVAIIPMPFIAWGSYYFGKIIKRRFKIKQEAFALLSDKVQEAFSGIKVIKSFVQEYYDLKDFDVIAEDNYDKNLKLAKLSAFLNPLVIFLVGTSLLISIGYGGYLTMVNEITIGEFVAFNQYILMLSWPMQAIAMGINTFAQGSASVKRIDEVLQVQAVVQDEESAKALEQVEGNIKLSHLNFNFPDNNQQGLIDVNLDIKKGETLAILGRTGSGKSTLVNLLLRIYNAPEGSIYIDGKDIMKATVQSVREHIAYVPQDNFLFSDTIASNIAFGADHLTKEQIEEAARKADVHRNIMDFPEQYDTVVGERGTTLSGGQKQRVSIARALILDAPILILDDSLSAVDTKTEELILENLKEVREGKTNIIIAHRISTVRHADHIVVLEEGRVAEHGNHESLLEMQGIYADMYEKQQLEEELSEA